MANFEIVCEVETKPTGIDGVRDGKWSEWSMNTAPADHVINRDSLKVEWLSDNGSENSYDLLWDDWEVIVPGTVLKFPRTIKVRVYARGPKGYLRGRGWSKVKFTGDYVKYR